MRTQIKGIVAASVLAMWPGLAAAVPAQVETDLNVRLGPATDYGIVDVLPAGVVVDVLACYSGWCEIRWEGVNGFASLAYLNISNDVAVVRPPSETLVVPGLVVYEARYYDRPVWTHGGRIIRREIRRDARHDLRQEIRQHRRKARHERHKERRANAVERRRSDHVDSRREQLRNRNRESLTRFSDRHHRTGNAAIRRERRQSAHAEQRRHSMAASRTAAERARAQTRHVPRGLKGQHERRSRRHQRR